MPQKFQIEAFIALEYMNQIKQRKMNLMFNEIIKEINWGGKTLSLETGKIARQADGAVIATYGKTKVLCTVVTAKKAKDDIDFFPLTVTYIEKTYAAGRIPGGFFKREGRPSESEVLTSRLIDRPIRPLFKDGFHNEVQLVCTVLSYDPDHAPDIAAMVGASAALAISGAPFDGPIAGARVAQIKGEFVLNPTFDQMNSPECRLDLVVAGTRDSVLMVESEAAELTEEKMLEAVQFGHDHCKEMIDMISQFAKEVEEKAIEKKFTDWQFRSQENAELSSEIEKIAASKLAEAYSEKIKSTRYAKIDEAKNEVISALVAKEFKEIEISTFFKKLEQKIVRDRILNQGLRIDGRNSSQIRQIVTEVGILPMVHGSALFTRGETQALVVSTLGSTQDEQISDKLSGETRDIFMLHYNFPPYSVGEAAPMRSPGRREIGHGKLAFRSLQHVLPTKEEFPYTIRVVSEITESNGSSSMATVCGASLSMMDAGVPLKKPVAGIAMGLIKEQEKFVVLSDIMGDEDHLGDMDFKVAGTDAGVTALQMDIKIRGITVEIMKKALEQAKEGRIHILGKMQESLGVSRNEINENAPKIDKIIINKEKIRDVIGSGGKVIREICEVSGCKVEIDDDGIVLIISPNSEKAKIAHKMIMDIVQDANVGAIYDAKVVKIMEFGFFANFLGSRDGLVHISEINDERVEKVEDVIAIDQMVKVKLLGVDNRGKFRLSMRAVNQETGEDVEGYVEVSGKPSSSGPKKSRDFSDRSEKGERRGDRGDRRRAPKGNESGNINHDKNGNSKDEPPVKKRKTFLF